MATPVERMVAPAPIPAAYQPFIDKLEPELHSKFDLFLVPYYIQMNVAKDGWTSLRELASIYADAAAARTESPADYAFTAGTNSYDAK